MVAGKATHPKHGDRLRPVEGRVLDHTVAVYRILLLIDVKLAKVPGGSCAEGAPAEHHGPVVLVIADFGLEPVVGRLAQLPRHVGVVLRDAILPVVAGWRG
jgi:hypothetical protein